MHRSHRITKSTKLSRSQLYALCCFHSCFSNSVFEFNAAFHFHSFLFSILFVCVQSTHSTVTGCDRFWGKFPTLVKILEVDGHEIPFLFDCLMMWHQFIGTRSVWKPERVPRTDEATDQIWVSPIRFYINNLALPLRLYTFYLLAISFKLRFGPFGYSRNCSKQQMIL